MTRLWCVTRNHCSTNFWGRGLAKSFGQWDSRTNHRQEREGRGCHAAVRGRREFVARGFVSGKLKSLREQGRGA